MSIISEALKKARESKAHAEGKTPEAYPTPPEKRLPPLSEPVEPPLPLPSRKTMGAILLSLLLIISPWIVYRMYTRVPSGPASGSAQTVQQIAAARGEADALPPQGGHGQFSVEERPAFFPSRQRQPEPPLFSLSGIAQAEDSYYAVINGKILQKGDRIQGAKIVAIGPDGVELMYKGERILLEKTF